MSKILKYAILGSMAASLLLGNLTLAQAAGVLRFTKVKEKPSPDVPLAKEILPRTAQAKCSLSDSNDSKNPNQETYTCTYESNKPNDVEINLPNLLRFVIKLTGFMEGVTKYETKANIVCDIINRVCHVIVTVLGFNKDGANVAEGNNKAQLKAVSRSSPFIVWQILNGDYLKALLKGYIQVISKSETAQSVVVEKTLYNIRGKPLYKETDPITATREGNSLTYSPELIGISNENPHPQSLIVEFDKKQNDEAMAEITFTDPNEITCPDGEVTAKEFFEFKWFPNDYYEIDSDDCSVDGMKKLTIGDSDVAIKAQEVFAANIKTECRDKRKKIRDFTDDERSEAKEAYDSLYKAYRDDLDENRRLGYGDTPIEPIYYDFVTGQECLPLPGVQINSVEKVTHTSYSGPSSQILNPLLGPPRTKRKSVKGCLVEFTGRCDHGPPPAPVLD